MKDTSERIIVRDRVKSLRNFERGLRMGILTETDKQELAAIVQKNGINSVEYELYLRAMDSFVRGAI